jgi:hypothetical protein
MSIMETNNTLLNEVLQNQHIIYAKLLKIEDKMKGVTSTSDRVKEAGQDLEKLRKQYFTE